MTVVSHFSMHNVSFSSRAERKPVGVPVACSERSSRQGHQDDKGRKSYGLAFAYAHTQGRQKRRS